MALDVHAPWPESEPWTPSISCVTLGKLFKPLHASASPSTKWAKQNLPPRTAVKVIYGEAKHLAPGIGKALDECQQCDCYCFAPVLPFALCPLQRPSCTRPGQNQASVSSAGASQTPAASESTRGFLTKQISGSHPPGLPTSQVRSRICNFLENFPPGLSNRTSSVCPVVKNLSANSRDTGSRKIPHVVGQLSPQATARENSQAAMKTQCSQKLINFKKEFAFSQMLLQLLLMIPKPHLENPRRGGGGGTNACSLD